MTPDTLLTLSEAARLIPGADADTLKRRARAGTLVVYRPGKAYLTTAADVTRMIEACRVERKAPARGCDRPDPAVPPLGSSSTALASAALDSALAQLPAKSKRR